jgi:hypothetical protein
MINRIGMISTRKFRSGLLRYLVAFPMQPLAATCFSSAPEGRNTKHRIWTIPNAITMGRIAASPMIMAAIAADHKYVALMGCIAAGASDWLDGYIAKNYDMMVHFTYFLLRTVCLIFSLLIFFVSQILEHFWILWLIKFLLGLLPLG